MLRPPRAAVEPQILTLSDSQRSITGTAGRGGAGRVGAGRGGAGRAVASGMGLGWERCYLCITAAVLVDAMKYEQLGPAGRPGRHGPAHEEKCKQRGPFTAERGCCHAVATLLPLRHGGCHAHGGSTNGACISRRSSGLRSARCHTRPLRILPETRPSLLFEHWYLPPASRRSGRTISARQQPPFPSHVPRAAATALC